MNKRLVITFPSTQLDFKALSHIKNLAECLSAPDFDMGWISGDFITDLSQALSNSDIQEVSLIMSDDVVGSAHDSHVQQLKNQLVKFNEIPVVAEGVKIGKIKTNAYVYSQTTGLFDEVADA